MKLLKLLILYTIVNQQKALLTQKSLDAVMLWLSYFFNLITFNNNTNKQNEK